MTPTLEQLSRVLALIHEAAAAPECWTEALSALTQLCEASKASILDIAPAQNRLIGLSEIGHDPQAQKEYAEHYFAIDPTASLSTSTAPYQSITAYGRFPAAYRERSEYFAFARSYDMGDVLGVATQESGGVRSILGVQRPLSAPAYDDASMRLIEPIAPHLEVAKRVHRRVAEALAARDAFAASLDQMADAAFIIDASQKILFLNTAAQNQLAADTRLRGTGGKLSFAAPRLQSAFQAAVQNASASGVRSQLLALPANGAERAEVAICPLRDAHPLASPWQMPLVLVMVSGPRSDMEAIAARMRQLYELTPAEARVVALLALGRSLEEIARQTGVQQSTLRSHLRSIRAKTGVSRQAELVRLALSGAAIASPK